MRLKLIAIIAAIAGPIVVFTGLSQKKVHEKLAAEGVKAPGTIDGGETRSGRKRGKTYKLDFSFTTKDGKVISKKGMSMPKSFVETHVQNDTITDDRIEVVYLPSDPNTCQVVGVESSHQAMIYGGAAIGVAGLAGVGFMLKRKK